MKIKITIPAVELLSLAPGEDGTVLYAIEDLVKEQINLYDKFEDEKKYVVTALVPPEYLSLIVANLIDTTGLMKQMVTSFGALYVSNNITYKVIASNNININIIDIMITDKNTQIDRDNIKVSVIEE